MLDNGITRDMFLVSCNPEFETIRYLVITGFGKLGRCTDIRDPVSKDLVRSHRRIKEKAIVGMHQTFTEVADDTIDILLRFSISKD